MVSSAWLPARWPDRREADPFVAMRKQMDSMFDEWSRFPPESAGVRDSGLASPKIDVSETDTEIHITAELPGVDEKDVEVTLQGDVLLIKGEKRSETEERDEKEGRRYHRFERSYGAFQRSFALPVDVVADKVVARELP